MTRVNARTPIDELAVYQGPRHALLHREGDVICRSHGLGRRRRGVVAVVLPMMVGEKARTGPREAEGATAIQGVAVEVRRRGLRIEGTRVDGDGG